MLLEEDHGDKTALTTHITLEILLFIPPLTMMGLIMWDSVSLLVAKSQGTGDGNNNSVSQSPVASNDYAITNVNQSITLDVLSNDSDAQNDLLTITDI